MMTSPTFAKWRPRRETRGKVTSWLFAAPRSVLSPYYFESCDFRQWEIRGVKKKCRPMNVCAFLWGKTTEHESFSAQRNVGQGAKHLKKKGEFQFSDPWKKLFWNLHKICFLMVVVLVKCIANSNSAVLWKMQQSAAPFTCSVGFHCNAMFILYYLAVGWKSKSTLFFVAKRCRLFVHNHKVAITKQFKHC